MSGRSAAGRSAATGRVVRERRERPGDGRDRARVAVRERLARAAGRSCCRAAASASRRMRRSRCLSACRKRVEDRLDRRPARALELGQCRLCASRLRRVATRPESRQSGDPPGSLRKCPSDARLSCGRLSPKNAERSVCHSVRTARLPRARLSATIRPSAGMHAMTDGPLRERLQRVLGRYVEPYLGMSLDDAGAVESVQKAGMDRRGRMVLGFPLGRLRESSPRQALDADSQAAGSRPGRLRDRLRASPAFVADAAPAAIARRSQTSSRSPRARAASASRRSRSTSRWRWRRRAPASACSTPTSTARASPG